MWILNTYFFFNFSFNGDSLMIIPWHEHKHRAKDWCEELACRSVWACRRHLCFFVGWVNWWPCESGVWPMKPYLMTLPNLESLSEVLNSFDSVMLKFFNGKIKCYKGIMLKNGAYYNNCFHFVLFPFSLSHIVILIFL